MIKHTFLFFIVLIATTVVPAHAMYKEVSAGGTQKAMTAGMHNDCARMAYVMFTFCRKQQKQSRAISMDEWEKSWTLWQLTREMLKFLEEKAPREQQEIISVLQSSCGGDPDILARALSSDHASKVIDFFLEMGEPVSEETVRMAHWGSPEPIYIKLARARLAQQQIEKEK